MVSICARLGSHQVEMAPHRGARGMDRAPNRSGDLLTTCGRAPDGCDNRHFASANRFVTSRVMWTRAVRNSAACLGCYRIRNRIIAARAGVPEG
jgi:hypothetical protein